MMKSLFVVFLIVAVSDALAFKKRSRKLNADHQACGIVMGAFNKETYVTEQYNYAQNVSRLKLPAGWCPGQPELVHVPIKIFSDVPNAAALTEKLQTDHPGEKSIEIIDMGTLASPKEPFKAPPNGFKGGTTPFTKHQPFWWWRPQMYMNSGFDQLITVDDDARICSGEGLASLFSLLKKKNTDFTASQWRHHTGKYNHGFMLMNRVAVMPWLEEWSKIMGSAIGSCPKFGGDQSSGNMAWAKVSGIRHATCANQEGCCRMVGGPICDHSYCFVHHEHGDTKPGLYDEPQFSLVKDLSPPPSDHCR